METLRPVAEFRRDLETRVLAPLITAGRWYYVVVIALAAVLAWGIYAYFTQLNQGLIVTGMRDRISWALYITLFVFFIGISHAGTLISAILRVTKAGWRTPITRMAEFITVVALMVGALMPMIDLGRPDRIHHLFLFGRFQSPLVWDVVAIMTYLTGSVIYMYLPLIPDFAIARDALKDKIPRLKWRVFDILSLGWHGTPGQQRRLTHGLGIMMILIIPIAVSVHTVVSWIFAQTLREPWDNAMFGAFFVAGAIYSGLGALVILMAILRKVYRLEEYITKEHFVNLGYMLACLALIMMYFNVNEFVTEGYKLAGEGEFHLNNLFTGDLAPIYWFYALGGMVLPGLLILFPQTRNVPGIVLASGLVVIGMFAERYFIVIGGLTVPLMPYTPATYTPTWVEWSIMAGAFAGFALVVTVFVKVLPLISIWEVVEHYEEEHARGRVPATDAPLPAPGAAAAPAGAGGGD